MKPRYVVSQSTAASAVGRTSSDVSRELREMRERRQKVLGRGKSQGAELARMEHQIWKNQCWIDAGSRGRIALVDSKAMGVRTNVGVVKAQVAQEGSKRSSQVQFRADMNRALDAFNRDLDGIREGLHLARADLASHGVTWGNQQ